MLSLTQVGIYIFLILCYLTDVKAISVSTNYPEKDGTVTLTSSAAGFSFDWIKDSSQLTVCFLSLPGCTPATVGNMLFSVDTGTSTSTLIISNANQTTNGGEYSVTVTGETPVSITVCTPITNVTSSASVVKRRIVSTISCVYPPENVTVVFNVQGQQGNFNAEPKISIDNDASCDDNEKTVTASYNFDSSYAGSILNVTPIVTHVLLNQQTNGTTHNIIIPEDSSGPDCGNCSIWYFVIYVVVLIIRLVISCICIVIVRKKRKQIYKYFNEHGRNCIYSLHVTVMITVITISLLINISIAIILSYILYKVIDRCCLAVGLVIGVSVGIAVIIEVIEAFLVHKSLLMVQSKSQSEKDEQQQKEIDSEKQRCQCWNQISCKVIPIQATEGKQQLKGEGINQDGKHQEIKRNQTTPEKSVNENSNEINESDSNGQNIKVGEKKENRTTVRHLASKPYGQPLPQIGSLSARDENNLTPVVVSQNLNPTQMAPMSNAKKKLAPISDKPNQQPQALENLQSQDPAVSEQSTKQEQTSGKKKKKANKKKDNNTETGDQMGKENKTNKEKLEDKTNHNTTTEDKTIVKTNNDKAENSTLDERNEATVKDIDINQTNNNKKEDENTNNRKKDEKMNISNSCEDKMKEKTDNEVKKTEKSNYEEHPSN